MLGIAIILGTWALAIATFYRVKPTQPRALAPILALGCSGSIIAPLAT